MNSYHKTKRLEKIYINSNKMNCDLKGSEYLNIRKLTTDFINFDEDEDEKLKIPSRGRKLNNYYLSSCEDSCKNTACDSIGIPHF